MVSEVTDEMVAAGWEVAKESHEPRTFRDALVAALAARPVEDAPSLTFMHLDGLAAEEVRADVARYLAECLAQPPPVEDAPDERAQFLVDVPYGYDRDCIEELLEGVVDLRLTELPAPPVPVEDGRDNLASPESNAAGGSGELDGEVSPPPRVESGTTPAAPPVEDGPCAHGWRSSFGDTFCEKCNAEDEDDAEFDAYLDVVAPERREPDIRTSVCSSCGIEVGFGHNDGCQAVPPAPVEDGERETAFKDAVAREEVLTERALRSGKWDSPVSMLVSRVGSALNQMAQQPDVLSATRVKLEAALAVFKDTFEVFPEPPAADQDSNAALTGGVRADRAGDQDELRERIANALCDSDIENWSSAIDGLKPNPPLDAYLVQADAVLAVLPSVRDEGERKIEYAVTTSGGSVLFGLTLDEAKQWHEAGHNVERRTVTFGPWVRFVAEGNEGKR